jgi:hypothetical protein
MIEEDNDSDDMTEFMKKKKKFHKISESRSLSHSAILETSPSKRKN